MAAQHLPRDLVRPSRGMKELAQTTKKCVFIRAGFRHVDAPGQSLCGGPQYLKEIIFSVKEILLLAIYM